MGKTTKTSRFLDNIQDAVQEYKKDVLAMSDTELYDHVYDGDYNPNDFASKELVKRGIGKCQCNYNHELNDCKAKSSCYWKKIS